MTLVTDKVAYVVADQNEAVGIVAGLVGLKITQRLIERTPVATHFAQRSWIATIGDRTDDVAGSKKSVDASAQEAGLRALEVYRLEQGQIFIQNNSEYIMVLNNGHSQQAPAAFVEGSIAQGIVDVGEMFP